jgi:AcrR family transcriptional regulator
MTASESGLTKGDKRERTRARLIDAALELTRERGFDGVTVQDIAERAGLTTGAIYGNFKNRDALFIALAERQWGAVRPVIRSGASFAELMEAMAAAVIAAFAEREAGAVGALTYRAYVLRTPEAKDRFRERMAQGYDAGAAWLKAAFDENELPMAPDLLARAINALVEGFTSMRLLTPELCPDEAVYAAFRALAGVRTASVTAPTR